MNEDRDDRTQNEAELNVDHDVLTVAEAAALLRVGRNTLYESIKAGAVPGVRRIGARRRVLRLSRAVLLAWLAAGDSAPVPPKAAASGRGGRRR